MIFRLFINLLYTSPLLALIVIAGIFFYTSSKRKNGMQGWNRNQYHRNTYSQNEQPFQYTSTSNAKKGDVFEAEYTEQEVH